MKSKYQVYGEGANRWEISLTIVGVLALILIPAAFWGCMFYGVALGSL